MSTSNNKYNSESSSEGVILQCSHGHKYSTKNVWHKHFIEGMRCPMTISYDRLSGSTYCRRILKAI